MYDWLLFLHVLAAFALGASAVIQISYALGAPVDSATFKLFDALFNAGGGGTIVFGIWLALYVEGYGIWDGWILGAVVLWAFAYETGRRSRGPLLAAASGGATATSRRIATWSWLYSLIVVLLLAEMVVKPGA